MRPRPHARHGPTLAPDTRARAPRPFSSPVCTGRAVRRPCPAVGGGGRLQSSRADRGVELGHISEHAYPMRPARQRALAALDARTVAPQARLVTVSPQARAPARCVPSAALLADTSAAVTRAGDGDGARRAASQARASRGAAAGWSVMPISRASAGVLVQCVRPP